MSETGEQARYPVDSEGFVDWLYVSHGDFNRDMYWGYPYLKGRHSDGHLAFGLGLHIKGDERNFPHEAQIHKGDIPQLVDRIKCFQTLRDGFLVDEEQKLRPLTQEEIDNSIERLCEIGIPRNEVIDVTTVSRAGTFNYSILNLAWRFGTDHRPH